MKFNFFQLATIGLAFAQAIGIENAPGADKKGRRERAARTAISTLTPVIPGVGDDPANVDDMGVIIDKIVAIQNRVQAVQDAKKHPKGALSPDAAPTT